MPLLERLLEQYSTIFDEPRRLPPARPYDHRIHLLPGTVSVAVLLYRYPQLQKDELEQQCAAMLAQGIIRPSISPFSAPVLLADGTWRFCIDYRALNDKKVDFDSHFFFNLTRGRAKLSAPPHHQSCVASIPKNHSYSIEGQVPNPSS